MDATLIIVPAGRQRPSSAASDHSRQRSAFGPNSGRWCDSEPNQGWRRTADLVSCASILMSARQSPDGVAGRSISAKT
jgi:hypothetical protein